MHNLWLRIINPIPIQIPRLHDGGDLRRIDIPACPKRVFILSDLLGLIAVDHVGGVPVGVLLRESSDAGIIIPRTEVVSSALYVEVFSAVPKRVGVGADAVFLVAESVVGVGFDTPSCRLEFSRRAVYKVI